MACQTCPTSCPLPKNPPNNPCCPPPKTKPASSSPTKCSPCGAPSFPICGVTNPTLTCRPKGRQWGRACGPVQFKCGKWVEVGSKKKRCSPLKIKSRRTNSLPYGFGMYARILYPYGLPCAGVYCLKKPACNEYLYPMLPTKPGKIYSSYTFDMRGPPYTCPRSCIKPL